MGKWSGLAKVLSGSNTIRTNPDIPQRLEGFSPRIRISSDVLTPFQVRNENVKVSERFQAIPIQTITYSVPTPCSARSQTHS